MKNFFALCGVDFHPNYSAAVICDQAGHAVFKAEVDFAIRHQFFVHRL